MSLETQFEVCLRLIVAAILSAAVGINRERYDHPAGLRTHMLVGIGAALFTAMSLYAFPDSDHSRIASQIVVGIGFLGAGSIIQSNRRGVRGITTAAGIWSTAAIGMASGAGLYLLAPVAALLIWFVLSIMGRLEKFVTRSPQQPENDPNDDAHQKTNIADGAGTDQNRKPDGNKTTGFRSID